ncbi:hypothetical protein VTN96DRAFT_4338 [Rasamsonia emersonii]
MALGNRLLSIHDNTYYGTAQGGAVAYAGGLPLLPCWILCRMADLYFDLRDKLDQPICKGESQSHDALLAYNNERFLVSVMQARSRSVDLSRRLLPVFWGPRFLLLDSLAYDILPTGRSSTFSIGCRRLVLRARRKVTRSRPGSSPRDRSIVFLESFRWLVDDRSSDGHLYGISTRLKGFTT